MGGNPPIKIINQGESTNFNICAMNIKVIKTNLYVKQT